jgi:hypothetical protein
MLQLLQQWFVWVGYMKHGILQFGTFMFIQSVIIFAGVRRFAVILKI